MLARRWVAAPGRLTYERTLAKASKAPGLLSVWLTRAVCGLLRRVGVGFDHLKLDWGELSKSALAALAVVGPLDPGHDL